MQTREYMWRAERQLDRMYRSSEPAKEDIQYLFDHRVLFGDMGGPEDVFETEEERAANVKELTRMMSEEEDFAWLVKLVRYGGRFTNIEPGTKDCLYGGINGVLGSLASAMNYDYLIFTRARKRLDRVRNEARERAEFAPKVERGLLSKFMSLLRRSETEEEEAARELSIAEADFERAWVEFWYVVSMSKTEAGVRMLGDKYC